jgi:hypothetical protein
MSRILSAINLIRYSFVDKPGALLPAFFVRNDEFFRKKSRGAGVGSMALISAHRIQVRLCGAGGQ